MHLLHMYPPIHLSCLWLVYPLTLTKCSCIRRAVGRRRLYTTFQWQTGYELFFQVSLPLFLQDFNSMTEHELEVLRNQPVAQLTKNQRMAVSGIGFGTTMLIRVTYWAAPV